MDLEDLPSEIFDALIGNQNRLPFDVPDLSQSEVHELYRLLESLFPMGLEGLSPELFQSIMEQIRDSLPPELLELSQLEIRIL